MAVSIVIDIRQNSQSIANNTTNVTVRVNAKWTGGSFNQSQKSGWVKIDGTRYTFTAPFNTEMTNGGNCNLYSKTLDIKHEPDGTKTLACSASYESGVSSGTVGASASVALPTIARKSSLSRTGNTTLGSAQTFTITKKNSQFQDTLTATCGGSSTTILSKSTATTATFTPPLKWSENNTTGTSVTITYKLSTYNGTTLVGSTDYKVTYFIPASVKPTCSVSVSDGAGYASAYGGYIQGKSTFKIAVTASGSQGSTISSYKVTADGSVYTTKNVTTGPINKTGNATISVEVTDSRGRTATVTYTANVLAYAAPKITNMSVQRTANNPDSLTVAFSSFVTSLNYSSGVTYTIRYKKTSESEAKYVTLPLTEHAGKTGSLEGSKSFTADADASYDVVLTVADPISSTSRARVGASAYKLFSIHRSGRGWAFGKNAEEPDAVDHAWPTYHRNSAYFDTNMKIYGKTVDGDYKNIFEPVNDNGNTTIGWDHYDAGLGNTNIYGHDLLFGVSNIASKGTYRPYIRRGDDFTVVIQTSGYVTNSKKDVTFMVPLSRPIVGSPIVTVSSNDGLILRQGGNYVYESASNVHTNPSSYSCTGTYTYGIRVTARFPVGEDNQLDALLKVDKITNNDVIGIYWSGRITLS